VLVALETFDGHLDPARTTAAVARGLRAGDATLEVDVCPIDTDAPDSRAITERLAAANFDARMRGARAVVVGAGRLDEATLLGSATFEIATRARQAGVPAYAVAAVNALSRFDARMLDLQAVLQARDVRALRRAGERLAGMV
jgi:glycerate kinase